ncbi:MAG: Rieske 2Fe-2S domain-containing protein [Pseudomonadota bacterium]
MEKIANLKDIAKGGSLNFEYKGKKALLVRTGKGDLFAYSAVCPHEGGGIEWDKSINMLLCECHLTLFHVKDGSVYKRSSLFELEQGLTKIEVSVDGANDIMAA